MLKNKTKSNLRLIFSTVSLAAFVLFSFCNNLLMNEDTLYYTYQCNELINNLFLLIPFVALFIYAVLERILEHINGRAYVFGLFVFYTVQALFILFGDSTSDFSIFTCSFLERASDITITILIVRMVMLILIPIAHKIMIKIYSVGMIAFFGFMMIGLLTTDSLYIRYTSHSMVEIIIAIVIDVLFHIGLFFFSDLLSKENEATSWLCLLAGIGYPVFGNLFDDDDKYDIFEDDNEFSEVIFANKTNQRKDNVSMSKQYEFFGEDMLKNSSTFDIDGEDFLLDPPENSVLHYELERLKGKTIVSGYFTYTFSEEQAVRILRKKSVLNKTFEDISFCARLDTNFGVESIEEGTFIIKLERRAFDTSETFDEVRNYMLRFMGIITIIQNTESYE